jgi:phosphoserine phosphatase RsbU/P
MATGFLPYFVAAPTAGQHLMGRVRDLRRLNQSAQRFNSILDLNTLLDRIVNDVVLRFGCRKTCILLTDLPGENLVLAASRGCSQLVRGLRFKIGQDGLVGHVAATGRTCYTPDVSREPRYIRCNADVRSEVNIPLRVRGRVIGIFSAAHPDLDGFSSEQLELLDDLAAHIAVAVENARRFEQERAHNEKLWCWLPHAGSRPGDRSTGCRFFGSRTSARHR